MGTKETNLQAAMTVFLGAAANGGSIGEAKAGVRVLLSPLILSPVLADFIFPIANSFAFFHLQIRISFSNSLFCNLYFEFLSYTRVFRED
ncbi:hypothetical protein L1887_10289 [Cichorium endivia]|nr:hypothetical protein L1887_10289 [Cichorium endivia]